jgi:1,5-anhydro-D-fructose reductase (1,5-anhydro-D-mannitol-forming)
MATVLVSTRAEYRTPLELVGERGVLFANDALNVERPIRIELRRDGTVVETDDVSNRLAYARQVDAFAAAVRGESAFPVSGEEGLRNQLVLDAAYRSAASGQVETIEV